MLAENDEIREKKECFSMSSSKRASAPPSGLELVLGAGLRRGLPPPPAVASGANKPIVTSTATRGEDPSVHLRLLASVLQQECAQAHFCSVYLPGPLLYFPIIHVFLPLQPSACWTTSSSQAALLQVTDKEKKSTFFQTIDLFFR